MTSNEIIDFEGEYTKRQNEGPVNKEISHDLAGDASPELGFQAMVRGPSPTRDRSRRASRESLAESLKERPPAQPTRFGNLAYQRAQIIVRSAIVVMCVGNFGAIGYAYGAHGDGSYTGQTDFLLPVYLAVPLLAQVTWCVFDVILVISMSRAYHPPPRLSYIIRLLIDAFLYVVIFLSLIFLARHIKSKDRGTTLNYVALGFYAGITAASLVETLIIFMQYRKGRMDQPRRFSISGESTADITRGRSEDTAVWATGGNGTPEVEQGEVSPKQPTQLLQVPEVRR